MKLDPKKLKKLAVVSALRDPSQVVLLQHIDSVEERLEKSIGEISKKVDGSLPSLSDILEQVKGTDGDDGYTPEKGLDYFDGDDYVLTEKDKAEIASQITVPVVEKIIERIETIKEQPTITEITKITNEIKEVAITENAEILRDKLEALKDNERLDISAIRGTDIFIQQQNLDRAISILDKRTEYLLNKTTTNGIVSHDSTLTGNGTPSSPLSVVGGGGGGGSISAITITGTVDDSNVSFVAASAPTFLVINGITYQQNTVWSLSGLNITLTIPVGVNGSIFGIGVSGLAVLTATGIIDDSNTSFTFTSAPTFLIINGAMYQKTGGAITWSGTTTVTLSIPVGINGSIFGL